MDVTAIIVAASIPSALTGFFFWLIEQSIQKRADKEKAEREERQKETPGTPPHTRRETT